MNRADLVDDIAKATGHTKIEIQHAVSAFLHSITGALLKGERVTLVGFGTFERRHRKARVGVNPQNPTQKLRIEAAKVPAFRAGQELKNIVDGRSKLPALKDAHSPSKAVKGGKSAKKKSAAPAKKKSGAKKKKR